MGVLHPCLTFLGPDVVLVVLYWCTQQEKGYLPLVKCCLRSLPQECGLTRWESSDIANYKPQLIAQPYPLSGIDTLLVATAQVET